MAKADRFVPRHFNKMPADGFTQPNLVSQDTQAAHSIRSLLICHEDSLLDREGLSRWLGSFSELSGIVVLRERSGRKFQRIKREIKRVGLARFSDVSAFRLYYKFFRAAADSAWEAALLADLRGRFGDIDGVPLLVTHSPNSPEAEAFIRERSSDIMIARCKVILNKRIFTLPSVGTFVMHPGICPEYRNAHGCFWALASGDEGNVGMTLLKVDDGVDTGPIYGYYRYQFDSQKESHFRIQTRVVTENLDAIREKLVEIVRGTAMPIDVTGRSSGVWGHPWMTKYIGWKRRARVAGV